MSIRVLYNYFAVVVTVAVVVLVIEYVRIIPVSCYGLSYNRVVWVVGGE